MDRDFKQRRAYLSSKKYKLCRDSRSRSVYFKPWFQLFNAINLKVNTTESRDSNFVDCTLAENLSQMPLKVVMTQTRHQLKLLDPEIQQILNEILNRILLPLVEADNWILNYSPSLVPL